MKPDRIRRKAAPSITSNRWLAYTTAGAATALGCAATAEAGITVVNVGQTFDAAPGGGAFAYFGIGGGGQIAPYHARTSAGINGVALFGIFGGGALRGVTASSFPYVAKLGLGGNIAGGPFLTANLGSLAVGPGFPNSQWTTAGQGYVGFRFTDPAGTEYGWASLTLNGTPNNAITLNSYAFTTAGEVITAGQTAIPEPGSLALLAMGGAGLLAWRQRRAKAAALPC